MFKTGTILLQAVLIFGSVLSAQDSSFQEHSVTVVAIDSTWFNKIVIEVQNSFGENVLILSDPENSEDHQTADREVISIGKQFRITLFPVIDRNKLQPKGRSSPSEVITGEGDRIYWSSDPIDSARILPYFTSPKIKGLYFRRGL